MITPEPRQLRNVLLVVFAALIAAAATAGLALARGGRSSGSTARIGTGVVVIETAVGYQGGQAAGTGIVLTSSGEVLTNNHVINGATTVRVRIPGSGQTYGGRVVGYSATQDVAVVELQDASHLRTAAIGDSSRLAVGQAVTALGNAGGTGTLTPARGKITGLRKTITAGDEHGESEQLSGLIETDAAVQPGDSGGPLLDRSGRVIGMDTAASTNGFRFADAGPSDAYAIPISRALRIARQIEAGQSSGSVHVGGTAFLGVEVQSDSSSDYGYGDGTATTDGALITGVVPGGPADSAGLTAGDVITAVDGHTVDSADALTAALRTRQPGAHVRITLTNRSGSSQTVAVRLGSGPPR